jgi:hypothetical protein
MMTEQTCPFTEEQLAWLKDNLKIALYTDRDNDVKVSLLLAGEVFSEDWVYA